MADVLAAVREFRVGSVLGREFSILFGNFVRFMFLTAIVYLPLFLYVTIFAVALEGVETMSAEEAEEYFSAGVIAATFGIGLLWLFLWFILTAALIFGTFEELRGQHATIGDCLSKGLNRVMPVLGVGLLVSVAWMLGFMLLVVPGFIIMTIFAVAIPVAVVERPGVINSLKRSAQLTKDNRWRIFGIFIVLMLISFIANMISAFLNIIDIDVIEDVVSVAISAFLGALNAVVVAVTYHDLRVTKEGVDTNQIAAVFD